MKNEIKEIIDHWVAITCDEKGINQIVSMIFDGKQQTLHYNMVDCVIGHLSEFTSKLLQDANQSNNQLDSFIDKLNKNVEGYLRFFKVNPKGPDIIKYFWSLGLESINYIKNVESTPLVVAVFKMNMIRGLDAIVRVDRVAAQKNEISDAGLTLIGKLYDAARTDAEIEMFGKYGIYSIFKMASVC